MKFRFFHIPVLGGEAAGADLNQFCNGKRIATVEKHFVNDGANSFWAVCVSFWDGQVKPPSEVAKKSKVDYREVLSPADFAVYVKLRQLRKTLSEQDGVPAYALFTNEQLAHMVENRVTTDKGLLALVGVGKGKLEKYGQPFLEILSREFPKGEQPPQQQDPAATNGQTKTVNP